MLRTIKRAAFWMLPLSMMLYSFGSCSMKSIAAGLLSNALQGGTASSTISNATSGLTGTLSQLLGGAT